MELIDKQVVADTGINPLAQFEPTASTLGQEELVEANRSIRNSSVDENYNIALDDALTMMLDRIKQFAPALLKETIKDSEGRVIKTIFPKIRIENYTVGKKDGKTVFVEDLGKYGYFELKPGVVQGIGVKITTASTNSVLPILERQKVSEFMNNVQTLANVAATDPTGEMMDKVRQFVRVDELMGWMSDAYGYDQNSLKANSKKDEIRKQNLDKIEKLKQVLSINPQNAQQNQGIAQQGVGTSPSVPQNIGAGNANPLVPQGGGVPELATG